MSMSFNPLHSFISPVTGKVPIPTDYILLGDINGFSVASPILTDIRLDMIDLRFDLDEIILSSFITSFPNNNLPNAQVLSILDKGFMFNTEGIISTLKIIPITALPDLTDGHVWKGDNNNRPVEVKRIAIDNLPLFGSSGTGQYKLWTGNSSGDPTVVKELNIANLPNLSRSYFYLGDANNRPVETKVLPIENLSVLTHNKVWQGDASNRPIETTLDFAPVDARYVLNTPNPKLTSAQALSNLTGGILKSAPITGLISIALGGKVPGANDYIQPIDLIEEIQATIAECNAFASAEVAAAEAAAIAAGIAHFTSQMLPFVTSEIPGSGVGIQITAAIGVVAALAALAKSTADNAHTRIDNLTVTLVGDVIGVNNISNPIVTEFTPNPRFTGKEYIKIPTGKTSERSSISEAGMLRYNIEI
jgi:hypothetical protein